MVKNIERLTVNTGVEDGRTDSPLLSVEQWHDVLSRNSFTGVDFATKDYDAPASKAAMIVSTSDKATGTVAPAHVEILFADRLGKQCGDFLSELRSLVAERGLKSRHSSLPMDQISTDSIYVILDIKDQPLLVHADAEQFSQVKLIMTQGRKVLWISLVNDVSFEKFPEAGLAAGIARVARAENELLRIITLDVRQALKPENQGLIQVIADIIETSLRTSTDQSGIEHEYIIQNDEVLIPRLIPNSQVDSLIQKSTVIPQIDWNPFHQPDCYLKLAVKPTSPLEEMVFVNDDSIQVPLHPDQIQIGVRAYSLNAKDISIALCRDKSRIGTLVECAGIVTAVGTNLQAQYQVNERVCGWTRSQSFCASSTRLNRNDMCVLPSQLDFTEGASIPLTFTTAYYSLIEICKLERGQTVLIHTASSGVGQAALMIAHHVGAITFVTVDSDEERQVIVDACRIPDSHVFLHRSTMLGKNIMCLTGGKGVEVILQSGTDIASCDDWQCIAEFGTIIRLDGEKAKERYTGTDCCQRNVTTAWVDMLGVAKRRPEKLHKILETIVSLFQQELLKNVQPAAVISMGNVKAAFALFEGNHAGNVVFEASEDTLVKVLPTELSPRQLDGHGTYVIAGGLGDIGQSIIRLMARCGARHILILSRNEPNQETRQRIERYLESFDTKLYFGVCDIGNESDVQNTMARCREDLPPIRGIIQAAVALQVCPQPFQSNRELT